MTMKPSIKLNKLLMAFPETNPEYSVEDYQNAVTAHFFLNIGPEPINTPRYQKWGSQTNSTYTNHTQWRSPKMVFVFTHKN